MSFNKFIINYLNLSIFAAINKLLTNLRSMNNNVSNLSLMVVPSEFLQKVESDLQMLKELMRTKNEVEINSQWIESVDVPKILGISRKTWQSYRDRRLIPFSQSGSKIYVKRSDLENFMESHLIGTRSKA